MFVLVTGGAGYIGSHVVLALLEAGYSPIVLDTFQNGNRLLVPENVPCFEGMCGDKALLSQIFAEYDVRAVIHLAASISVPESVEQPLRYYHNNVVQSLALLEACKEQGIHHLVFSSTAAVYGNPEVVPVTEEGPLLPISPYGRSKKMVEEILSDLPKMQSVILRYFNVAGADPALRAGQTSPNATHLIKIISEVATGKRSGLAVYGTDYPTRDGSCIRDYIHVSDLATIHVRALHYLEQGGQSVTLNCGDGQGYSVLEVIEACAAIIGKPLSVTYAPRRAGDPALLTANTDKIKRVLGFTPQHQDLKHIIETAIAWEKHWTIVSAK